MLFIPTRKNTKKGDCGRIKSKNIVVTRNPIVDILNEFYYKQKTNLKKWLIQNFSKIEELKMVIIM